jgi:hypothetical protein
MKLTAQNRDVFFKALLSPAHPNERLRQAAEEHRKVGDG